MRRELAEALWITPLALLLAVGLAFPFLNSGGEVVEVQGMVVAPFVPPDDGPARSYMRVALASGEEVRVSVPRTTMVVPGRTVLLTSRTGRLGVTVYRFGRYADEARGDTQ